LGAQTATEAFLEADNSRRGWPREVEDRRRSVWGAGAKVEETGREVEERARTFFPFFNSRNFQPQREFSWRTEIVIF